MKGFLVSIPSLLGNPSTQLLEEDGCCGGEAFRRHKFAVLKGEDLGSFPFLSVSTES